MTEGNAYSAADQLRLTAQLQQQVSSPVFVCIGTDKVFADSLGPRVGSLLNKQMKAPCFVYGMCGQNITAENLLDCYDFVKAMHPTNQIVVVDAAVGNADQIGNVQLLQGGIVPGAATNKQLPRVGDVSIVGIVADKNMDDFYAQTPQKETLVNAVAQFIAKVIVDAKIAQ